MIKSSVYNQEAIPISQSEYKKKGPSKSSKMTVEEITKALSKYEEVEDINKVPLNVHIKYIIWVPEESRWRYRPGGFLKRNEDPRYIKLTNKPVGGLSWSVQTEKEGKKTKFYRYKSPSEFEEGEKAGESQKLQEKYLGELKKDKKAASPVVKAKVVSDKKTIMVKVDKSKKKV